MINFKDKLLGSYYFSWLQIFTNWLMQGIFHADKSERNYKILFTILFSFLVISIFYFTTGQIHIVYFLYSFLISHSVNFFLNCNLSVLFIHRIRWFKTNKKDLFKHLFSIKSRLDAINNKDWILFCVSHGGICNGTLNKHSDIDVSIVRKPGFTNLIKAIIFYVKEKKIADLNMVPLDIFICDSAENTMNRSNFQKNPIVLLDHNRIVDKFYKDKLKISLEEAKILNGI